MRDEVLEGRILDFIDYDMETGIIKWKPRSTGRSWHDQVWNLVNAGKPIGFHDKDGYLCMNLKGSGKSRGFKVHRVIWFIHYGEWPDGEIDHINHDKADNRICNLRTSNRSGNQRNLPLRKSSASGFTGVSWHTPAGKWRARLMVNRKEVHLGLFSDPEKANEAVVAARLANDYHENHGAPQ